MTDYDFSTWSGVMGLRLNVKVILPCIRCLNVASGSL